MSDETEPSSPLAPSRPETGIKAALALIPVIGGALAVVADDHMDRRRARVEQMVTEAVALLPDNGEGLVQRVRDDEEFADLFFTAVRGASETHVEAKRRTFARLLADGMDEAQGELDEIALMMQAVEELDLMHLRTLKRLATFTHPGQLRSLVAATPEPVFAGLRRHGLLKEEEQYDGTEVTGVSNFGQQLLTYVEQSGPIPAE